MVSISGDQCHHKFPIFMREHFIVSKRELSQKSESLVQPRIPMISNFLIYF